MVAQVAISCVLVSLAMLFARSLVNLTQLDAGFERDNVLILSVASGDGGPKGAEAGRLYGRVLEHLATLPGVRSAALTGETLFGGGRWTEAITAPEFNPAPGQNRDAVMLVVSAYFFRTMGTRLLAGRDFDSRDNQDGQKVAVVNESMASYFLGTRDAVGRSFQVAGFPLPLTVVGVARRQYRRCTSQRRHQLAYFLHAGTDRRLTPRHPRRCYSGDPETTAGPLELQAHRQALFLTRYRQVQTQARPLQTEPSPARMLAQLSGAFGIAGALLVSIGLFGLTAYEVSRRTAELGVRIALGATRRMLCGWPWAAPFFWQGAVSCLGCQPQSH